MADRNINVRLSAQVGQFVAAMQTASASAANVSKSGADMAKLGGQLSRVGQIATIGLTAPIVAAGVAAVGSANKFNTSFTRMTTLAGITTGEVDKMRGSVLNLAKETGQGPQKLADALYAASSSGLSAAQSMNAVEIAAKGAASGLGSADDIISLVASATASYGAANMDAAKATDILVGTIREGRADPDELAGSLGRILPVAANLGVSFEEVGGSVAFLSNVFGDTNRTVTAMSGVLNKLQSPTDAAREALAKYGTTMEELHGIIAEDGLLGAMQHLQAIGLSDDPLAFRAVFDDIEARQGAQAMIDNLSALEGAIGGVKDSAGALEEAWTAAQGEEGFKMAQAWAEIQVAMVEFGDAIGPIAADIASAVGQVAGAFASLPDGVQMAIAGVLIAVGPMAMIAGTMMKHAQTIAAARALMFGTAGAGVGKGLLAGVPLAATAAAWVDANQNPEGFWGQLEWATDPNQGLRSDFSPGGKGFYVAPRGSVSNLTTSRQRNDPNFMGPVAGRTTATSFQGPDYMGPVLNRPGPRAPYRPLNVSGSGAGAMSQFGNQTAAGRDTAFTSQINALVAAGNASAEAANRAREAWSQYSSVISSADWGNAALVGATSAMSAYSAMMFGAQNSVMAYEEAIDRLDTAISDNGFTFDLNTEKGRANHRALQDVSATLDGEFAAAYANAGGSMDSFKASATEIGERTLGRLQKELGLTDEQTALLRDELNLTEGDYEARFKLSGDEEAKTRLGLLSGVIGLLQDDVQREVAMKIATGDFQGALDLVQANIAETPRQRTVTVDLVDNASWKAAAINAAIGAIQGKTVTVTTAQRTVYSTVGSPRMFAAGGIVGAEGGIGGEAGVEMVRLNGAQALIDRATWLPPGTVVTPLSGFGGGGGSASGSMGGGGNVYLTVNAGLGTDGYHVGQQIVDALAKHVRINGPGGMQRLTAA